MWDPAKVREGRPLPAHFRPCPTCGSRVLMVYRTDRNPTGTPSDHRCVDAVTENER